MLKAILSFIFVLIGGIIMWDFINNSDKTTAYRKANSIFYEGKRIAESLKWDLENNYNIDISFDNILYEETFFLYCLEVVKLINNNYGEKLCNKIKDYLFLSFEELTDIHFLKNKIAVEELFNQRKMNYLALFKSYDLKLNTKLLNAAFDFQSEVLSVNQQDKEKSKNIIRNIFNDYIENFKSFYNTYI